MATVRWRAAQLRGTQVRGARWRATRRGGAGALGAVLVAGALGACSGQPGAAAVVDGQVISVEDVQTATTDLAPFYQGVTPAAVLAVLVQEPLLTSFAADQGLGVSEEDALAALTELSTQSASAEDREFSASAVAVQRYLLVSAALQEADDAEASYTELQAAIAAQDIEVSTRFGTLDENNTLVDAIHPWIVTQPDA